MKTAHHFASTMVSAIVILMSYAAPGVAQQGPSPAATQIPRKTGGQAYPGLNSALWMLSAAEYRAASVQAYRLATLQLDAALRDRTWTAATEQKGNYSTLPPAIILDIDETIFDNAPYNTMAVKKGTGYDVRTFIAWSASGRIQALPGSLRFAKEAARKGVTLFYVTNRGTEEKTVTIQNLHRLGFPIRSAHHLLLKSGQLGWTSDKTRRRAYLAQKYRILLLIGDDFNDFISAPRDATPRQRLQISNRYNEYWGTRWIILPNPYYGSWERSILGNGNLTNQQQLQRKLDALP